MGTSTEYRQIMKGQTALVLATVKADGMPNVPYVNFSFDPGQNRLYFATFKENDKVQELKQQPHAAFTILAVKKKNEHVKPQGIVGKSAKIILELADCFCQKIPGYNETSKNAGKSLIFFDIQFDPALVTLNLATSQKLVTKKEPAIE